VHDLRLRRPRRHHRRQTGLPARARAHARGRPRARASARPARALPRRRHVAQPRARRPARGSARRRARAGHAGGADRAGRGRPAREERRARRGEPAPARRARDLRAEPGVEPRLGQDHAARAHDRNLGPARAGRRDRRRPADLVRRRPHPCHGRARRAGQHRQGLPPRRDDGRARTDGARPAAGKPRVHRERRQPGVPRGVRPGRGAQGGDPVGHRGRGQAAQVPRHVPRRRPDAGVEGRPRTVRELRHRQGRRLRPPRAPGPRGDRGLGDDRGGVRAWLGWLGRGLAAAASAGSAKV